MDDLPIATLEATLEPVAEQKPGWQTSEFWLTMVAQAVPILVLLGVFKPEDALGVKDTFSAMIVTGFAFLAALVAGVMYIWSRVQVKTK